MNEQSKLLPLHPVDESECPQWGTAEDGRRVLLKGDERLPALFAQWQADACRHSHRVVIRFTNAGGQAMHQHCCTGCGYAESRWLKREDAEREGVAVDFTKDRAASLSNQYRAERLARLTALANSAADRIQPQQREEYSDYLRSPAWQRRRSKVLSRANHTCEGCLTNPATDVHHLTYAHKGAEFAFELVALCEPCHTRWHQPERAE
ncbi:HNH endonuclease [Novosphingobium olei]|uniref:HNH endonuclease n=1 Tax=Novosphingobium olei TaxID=2728851 RepID=A0A7Y0G943_9SPHN|nr:HNH endonuclease [Novosphingobium olei]NML93786.1 HNH endonuclease [Novosphingobium olei]